MQSFKFIDIYSIYIFYSMKDLEKFELYKKINTTKLNIPLCNMNKEKITPLFSLHMLIILCNKK
jgi:hypothetical protein